LPESRVKPPSLWEPVSALRRIPIQECGEPLVDFIALYPELILDRPRYNYRRETLLRHSVAERLGTANQQLMQQGYRLLIIEGWRAPHIQRRMYRATWNWWKKRHPDWSEITLRRVVKRFTAPINDTRVPPPHTTGSAIDLMLADLSGNVLDHSAPYEPFDPRGYPFAAPELGTVARENRAILRNALEAVGITNYPSEYWHWSFGDQGWAYRGGHAAARYGAILPDGWRPDAEETMTEPLEPLSE